MWCRYEEEKKVAISSLRSFLRKHTAKNGKKVEAMQSQISANEVR